MSEDLPEETPPPLANPQESPDDLDALLKEFAETRSLGKALDVERGKSASHYIGGTLLHGDDLIRAWYLTNGCDVAFASYVVAAASSDAVVEPADAGTIVRSIDFG